MKIFRKIRESLIKEDKVSKYLTYAVGEIFLVTIGILLAFQVNSWNTQQIKNKAAMKSYANIKRQINDDKNVIIGNKDYNILYLKQYEFATEIIEENDRNQIDTLGYIVLNLTKYSDVNRNSNIYQNLVNSGELKLLTNQEVIEKLQRLEETYSYMNRMEKIHLDAILFGIVPDLQTVMKFSDRSVQIPNQLYGYEFQNNFLSMIGIMNEKDEIYNRAVNEIDAITELIDNELNSDIEN
jgi:hypothetical protein